MLESYQVEIIKRRRAARIFWLIVFVCAIFLYFFFQGYYPDVRVGFRRILSEGGYNTLSGSSSDLIRSFGIINVRTTELDTSISLGSGAYGNNEKRMSDYGDYMMQIGKPGYLSSIHRFVIDREKPYFIEKIDLLPEPSYKKFNNAQEVYPLENGDIIIKSSSGYILSGSTITRNIVYTGSLRFIGNRYFHTGTGVVIWENNSFEKADPAITNFIQTCKNIEWKYDLFYCPRSKSLITEGGRYMSGIVDIRDNLIEKSGSIIQIVDGTIGKIWTQTGEIDLNKVAILNGVFYKNSSGSLIPKEKSQEIIKTPLDVIHHISNIDDAMVFIGTREGAIHIVIRYSGEPGSRIQDIVFPENLSYSNIKIHSLKGNIMIETPRGIVFVYRKSQELHWIVEGEILSYDDNGAIYKKNNEIWGVDWREKI